MNVFLAGIHGVGKTHLAAQLPPELGLRHTSASRLISEERTLATWDTDKRVTQVDENQLALRRAVHRHNSTGTRLLLDGHFVLLDTRGLYVHIAADVFESLDLNGVVLLEADPSVIVARTYERDRIRREKRNIEEFMAKERCHAQAVCRQLSIPLTILTSPDYRAFVYAVRHSINTNT